MDDFIVFAQRLEVIAQNSPQLTHTFRFLASAIGSLRDAEVRGHKNRSSYTEADRDHHLAELLQYLKAVRTGAPPNDQWVAAFNYNAAIMRIDACYERLLVALKEALRVVDIERKGKKSKTDSYAESIERKLQLSAPIERANLELNRQKVNRLKHRLFGHLPHDFSGDELASAFSALDELLTILEIAEVQQRLRSDYAEPPPA